MKFKKKVMFVDAVQWNKHGDHPAVTQITADNHFELMMLFDSFIEMDTCGGMVNVDRRSAPVYPTNWIVTDERGNHVLSNEEFVRLFEPVNE